MAKQKGAPGPVALGNDGKLSAHDARRVAVEAGVDPRSVRKFFEDREAMRDVTAGHIVGALTRLGYYAKKGARAT